MNVRKGLTVMTAALIAAWTLTACSGKTNGAKEANAATSGVSAEAAEEPVEIKWIGFYPPDSDNSYVQQYLEKKFRIAIKNMRLDRTASAQQLNVKLAMGDIPDIIPPYVDINAYANMVQQGIAAELPLEEIRHYMPRYAKFIDDLDPSLWNIGMIDGKNYGIPKTYAEGDAYFVPAYNAAWLRAIGYSEPPRTLAELEDVLTKFRENDPDGNGKKDTYGFSARGKDTLGSNQIFNTVFGAYGINPNAWMETNGKLQFGITLDGAKQAFITLNKWYKAELIDPEFITMDWNQYRVKFVGGKVGMSDQALWYHLDPSGTLGADALNAGMTFVVGQPLQGPGGKRYAGAQGLGQVPYMMSAEAYKDEKKRETIYRIMDALAMDPEVYRAAVYGEKGVHYDEIDGAAVLKPAYTDEQKAGAIAGIGYYYGLFKMNTFPTVDRPKSQLDFRAGIVRNDVIRLIDALPQAYLPSWAANSDAITKLIKEYELKFVTGAIDPAKGFDDFVALLNKAGLHAATDEANKLYAERKNLK